MKRVFCFLAITILLFAIGSVTASFLLKPKYDVIGHIRVTPSIQSKSGKDPNQERTAQTLAMTLVSPDVLVNVEDSLDKDIRAILPEAHYSTGDEFNSKSQLQIAVDKGILNSALIRGTDIISVTMRTKQVKEAKFIVNELMNEFRHYHQRAELNMLKSDLAMMKKERDDVKTSLNIVEKKRLELQKLYNPKNETKIIQEEYLKRIANNRINQIETSVKLDVLKNHQSDKTEAIKSLELESIIQKSIEEELIQKLHLYEIKSKEPSVELTTLDIERNILKDTLHTLSNRIRELESKTRRNSKFSITSHAQVRNTIDYQIPLLIVSVILFLISLLCFMAWRYTSRV